MPCSIGVIVWSRMSLRIVGGLDGHGLDGFAEPVVFARNLPLALKPLLDRVVRNQYVSQIALHGRTLVT